MDKHTDPRGRRNSAFPGVFVARVAERCRIDAGYLSKILRGLSTPSLKVAQRIANEFGLTLDELIVKLDRQKQIKAAAKRRLYTSP